MDFPEAGLVNYTAVAHMLIRLGFNLFVTFLIVWFIYYPLKRDKDYVFTFIVFNLLIFFVCYFMSNINLSVGFAFGLFALFGILRYRTMTIPIKEMTYLFTVIVIAIINALSSSEISLVEILISNTIIVMLIFLLERVWFKVQQGYKIITYENIDLIKPGKSSELLQDLKERTGLEITEIDIDSINYLTDSARIKVYYNKYESGGVSRVDEG